MGNPVDDIEVELRRRPTLQAFPKFRKDLSDRFAALTPDQAAEMLDKILTPDATRIPVDFRVLSRHVRLELLSKLLMRLGTQRREEFAALLLGKGGKPPDPKLQKGLRLAFPPGTEPQRDKFIKALSAPVPSTTTPVIALEFRGINQPVSPDNQCPARWAMPDILGFDPDPESARNWMEIRGSVRGHHADVSYRFGRTIELGKWCFVRRAWRCIEYLPAGTDDDATDTDEDTHPDNDHIYVMDSPGPPIPPNLDELKYDERRDTTEFVYMMNAVETVDVKVGSKPWSPAGRLEWFTVSWLENVSGKWRRKDGKNTIAPGSISGIPEGASVGEPPMF